MFPGPTREEMVRQFAARYHSRQAEMTGRGEIITVGEQVSADCDIYSGRRQVRVSSAI